MYFTKNVFLNWYYSMKKCKKIQTIFGIENWLNVHISWLLTPLLHLSVTDIKKIFGNIWFFWKNEASVTCAHKCHNLNLVNLQISFLQRKLITSVQHLRNLEPKGILSLTTKGCWSQGRGPLLTVNHSI